jgi:hypothetical protein
MTRARFVFLIGGLTVLLALSGCGRGFMQAERPAWRHQAEAQCMQSGAVKLGYGVVQAKPIEGPGMCGADYPLKVSALGEPNTRIGYSDAPRPPGGIANSPDMPAFPRQTQYFDPAPLRESAPAPMRWQPGAPSIGAPQTTAPRGYEPQPYGAQQVPARQPVSLDPQGVARPDDIPDDAVLPRGRAVPERDLRPAYDARAYEPPRRQEEPQRDTPPPLGPARGPYSVGAIPPAELRPAATLACPLVSALERWVSEGVQPAALHWFRSPVVELRQISAYSCREMNGAGGHGISEHAFGNALDVAAFTLADGRKITVKDGWHGTPEEQGFLHDVQIYACETFVTVLGPGYNAEHYNHFHLDLMRRKPGYRPCRPTAIRGEVVAARARAVYASRHRGYTGALGDKVDRNKPKAVPGADGLDDDAADMPTGSIGGKGASTAAVPGADGLGDDDDDATGSIGETKPDLGWPRVAPQLGAGSAGAIH